LKRPILLVLLILIVLGLAGYLYLNFLRQPYGAGGIVLIPKGSSVGQIAKILKDKDLIRSARFFSLNARFKDVGGKLQAGEYEIKAGMTPDEILQKLVKGDRIVRKLVIPEGFTFQQIAKAIQSAGIAPTSEVITQFRNPELLARLGFPADSLEGFLFPATYEYDSATQVEALLAKMIDTFLINFDQPLKDKAVQGGWTIPQVVTLASIIERETGQAAERPVIAAVFQNRLQIGMPLQSDPTVIYGLKNFDGNIRKADLSNPHPWNTYVHVGLPPSPIASPGKAALTAALNPAPTGYLFFVGKGDGTHAFSSTVEEHNALVARYQLGQENRKPTPSPTPVDPRPVRLPTPLPAGPEPTTN